VFASIMALLDGVPAILVVDPVHDTLVNGGGCSR